MKVKDLIKYLQDRAQTGDEIVVLWDWDRANICGRLIDIQLPTKRQVFEFKPNTPFIENQLIALIPNHSCIYNDNDFQLSQKGQ